MPPAALRIHARSALLAIAVVTAACATRPDVLWAPGTEHVYAFKILRAVRAPGTPAPLLDVRVHAMLHVLPHAPVDGRQRLDLTIREMKLFGADGQAHAADLRRSYQVELQNDVVTGLYVEPKTGAATVSLMRTLASVMQLSRPDNRSHVRYQAEEYDEHGRYLAGYDRSTPGELLRTKLRYDALLGSPPAGPPLSVQVAGSTLSLNLHEGAIASANFYETLTLIGDTTRSSSTKLHLTLRRQIEGVTAKPIGGLVYVPSDKPYGAAPTP